MALVGKKLGFASALAMAFVLMGCKDFGGTLVTTETLKLNTKKASVMLAPGEHSAVIKFSGSKKVKLVVEDKTEALFKLPKNAQLPSYAGSFALRAQDTGQAYDLVGSISTNTTDGQIQHTTEYCSVSHTERECWVNEKKERVCKERVISIPGNREVEYFNRQTDQTLVVELRIPDGQRPVGTFKGFDGSNERITTFVGPCVIR